MLSIGAGAEQRALAMIERLGVHNVLIKSKEVPPSERAEARKKSMGLAPRDVTAIREAVPHVALVAPRARVEAYKVIADGYKAQAKIWGVLPPPHRGHPAGPAGGPLLRRRRRAHPRPGLCHRRGRAPRPLRRRPGGGAHPQGERPVAARDRGAGARQLEHRRAGRVRRGGRRRHLPAALHPHLQARPRPAGAPARRDRGQARRRRHPARERGGHRRAAGPAARRGGRLRDRRARSAAGPEPRDPADLQHRHGLHRRHLAAGGRASGS